MSDTVLVFLEKQGNAVIELAHSKKLCCLKKRQVHEIRSSNAMH